MCAKVLPGSTFTFWASQLQDLASCSCPSPVQQPPGLTGVEPLGVIATVTASSEDFFSGSVLRLKMVFFADQSAAGLRWRASACNLCLRFLLLLHVQLLWLSWKVCLIQDRTHSPYCWTAENTIPSSWRLLGGQRPLPEQFRSHSSDHTNPGAADSRCLGSPQMALGSAAAFALQGSSWEPRCSRRGRQASWLLLFAAEVSL